jgi:hypothetical protein
MSDDITAKGSSKKYLSHPQGQFTALCVDTVALGEKVVTYPGTPDYLATKCAIVFRTGEKNPDTGDLIDVAQEFTVSMGDKANLRKFLESWRGKPYTSAQLDEGVPLHKLTSQWALLTVAHKTSAKSRTYAIIQSAVPLPAVMKAAAPTLPVYTRAEYWDTRKQEYAKAAQDFRALHAAGTSDDAEDSGFPSASDDDTDLPF